MHQPLWRCKFEEKLYLGGTRTKKLNTAKCAGLSLVTDAMKPNLFQYFVLSEISATLSIPTINSVFTKVYNWTIGLC